MKNLIADLVEKLAIQEASHADAFIQLDAIEIVVMALFTQLDEESRRTIKENIARAFERVNAEALTDLNESERLRRATFNLLNREIILPVTRGHD